MPYGKRRYAPKRRSSARSNLRRIKYRRPSARNQRRQIKSNQRQLMHVKQQLNLSKERIRWQSGFTGVEMTASTGINIIPLTSGPSTTNPAQLNNVSGIEVPWNVTMTPVPQASTALRSKYIINTQYVDLTINAPDAADAAINYTAFLVQLRPETAQQTYQTTGSMDTLVRGTDYTTALNLTGGDSGYGAYMNTSRFKIIKRLEFDQRSTGGAWNQPLASTGNTGQGTRSWNTLRTQFKVPYGNTLMKSTGQQASGLGLKYEDLAPEQKRFIVIFSTNRDNVDAPQVGIMSMSCLTTGYSCE
ncbi:MAG: putative capsid protein [Circoviridae sp.]|nr:MAG: putative capsid protein [Circoviridae sp.]